MTTDQQDEFIDHMRSGMRRGAAAELMELTRLEVVDFIAANPTFERKVCDAEEMATEHVEEALYQAAVSGSVPAAKLWLELKPRRRSTAPITTGDGDDTSVVPARTGEDDFDALLRMTME